MNSSASDAEAGRNDAALVAACRAGERQAFVEIVQRHQSLVCAVAYNVTGRLTASEEVAQDTFVTAWRKMGELREPACLRGWLTRIAHALAVDWIRRQRPGAVPLEAIADYPAPEAAPDEAAASEEEQALVWKALEGLPESTRLPLVLFYREEQSIAAVAAALELSEDAVKQRLARGRAALRDRLAAVAESVLGKSRPGAVFTFSVMAAIGALAAPAALAATAFAGSSAVASGAAATSATSVSTTATSAAPPLVAAMSASKTAVLAAAAVAALCLPVGWSVRESRQAAAAEIAEAAAASAELSAAEAAAGDFKSSVLYVEWQKLHDEHGTTREAMPALYQAISEITDGFRRRAFRAAHIAEWVALDPAAALAHFRSLNNRDLAQQTMREWMLRDPREAVAGLMTSGPGWENLGREFLGDIARLTPDFLPAVVAGLPAPSDPWNTTILDAFAVAAAKDLTAMREAAEALSGRQREQALAGVAAAWVVRDAPAALEWAKALPDDRTRREVLRGLLLGWAKHDPLAALNHLDLAPASGEPPFEYILPPSQVLTVAAEKDFPAVMRWLKENQNSLGDRSFSGMKYVLSERLLADVPGTLALLQDGAPAGLTMQFDMVLSEQEGYSRAAEIRAWLNQQSPGEFADRVRLSLIQITARREPLVMLDWLREMPAEQKTPAILAEIARRLLNGGSDYSQADELIASAPPELRTALISFGFGVDGISGDWPGGDVTPWLSRLDQVPADDRARASAVFAQKWTAVDPQAAVAWAATLTDDDARRQSYAAIAARWALADSYEASEWIAGLPAGAERDAAVFTLVYSIAPAEPDSAWRWAQTIADERQRQEAVANAIAIMAFRNPVAGREALVQVGADMPGEMRVTLEGMLQGHMPGTRPAWLRVFR